MAKEDMILSQIGAWYIGTWFRGELLNFQVQVV